MKHYTPDSSLDGKTRKRQSAIDLVRLALDLQERLAELTGDDSEADEVNNVVLTFREFLPKADQEELRQG